MLSPILTAALASVTRPALREVEAGGILWRLQRLDSGALVRAGMPVLLAARVSPSGAERPIAASEYPEMLGARARARDLAVCEAVVEVSADRGATWEPVRVVADRAEDCPAEGRYWVGSFEKSVRRTLADAVDNQDAEVAARIEDAFPRGPDAAPADGPGGDAVPDPAAGAPADGSTGPRHPARDDAGGGASGG